VATVVCHTSSILVCGLSKSLMLIIKDVFATKDGWPDSVAAQQWRVDYSCVCIVCVVCCVCVCV